MRDLAQRFAALADPTRLEMLALLLREGELCVCDFVEVLGITQSKASRHLRYLWNAGLLVDRRAGLWVHYRVSPALDADSAAIVKALGTVLGRRDLSAIEQRLARWRRDKGDKAPTCKIPAPAADPAPPVPRGRRPAAAKRTAATRRKSTRAARSRRA